MRVRARYSASDDIVPSSWTTLNGKPVGDATGSVKTWAPPAARELQDARLRRGVEARLVAVRERGPDLDARRAARERVLQALGRAAPARQPERQAQLAHLREVHDVALAVHGLAGRRERAACRAAARCGRRPSGPR